MTRAEEIRISIDKMFPCRNGSRTYEQAIAATGFEAGVRYADKHPDISQLWHKPSEKPEEGELIVCIDIYDELLTGTFYEERVDEYHKVYESAVWDIGTLICYWNNVSQWVYAKDILPKGGEK